MFSLTILALLSKFSALFASVINFASAWLGILTPVVATIMAGLTWYFGRFTSAALIIGSNLVTLTVIVPLMLASGYYGHKTTAKKCETKTITKLRTQYKFVPRTPEKQPRTNLDLTNPLGWWK